MQWLKNGLLVLFNAFLKMCSNLKQEETIMNFGGIEFGRFFGSWELVNCPASKLPQDVASAAWGAINSGLLGATYYPEWYVGNQVVKGKNHFFLCKEVRSTKNQDTHMVGVIINVPPSPDAFKGENAKIVEIIEETKLDTELEQYFKDATEKLVGVHYKPLVYVGSQLVKGVNHFIICEAKMVKPGAEPYLVLLCFNVFQGETSIVSIERVEEEAMKNGPLGYAFTW